MAKEEKIKPEIEIVEVPTEVGLMFRNNKTEQNLSQMELLAKISNDILEIKKGIVGDK